MRETPTLDVIIQTYNRAMLFEKTLRSVCDQTYQDFVIKVFDNGSTDDTKDVCEKVIKQYPERQFEYKRLNENLLDDFMFKEKCDLITADYVIVFHDDDLMHPRYVEHLMKVISEHPECVIFGGKTKISEHPEELKWDEPTGKFIVGDMRDMVKWYFIGDTMTFSAICYKSYWYKNTKFRDDLYGNRGDFPFLMDIAEHGKVCRLEDRFLHYRISKNQDSVHMPSFEKRMNLMKKMADILLNGDKECQNVFYSGIEAVFIPNGYLDYESAIEQGWIRLPEKKRHSSIIIYPVHLLKYFLYSALSFLFFNKKAHFKKKAKRNYLKSYKYTMISADKSNEIRIANKLYLKINVNIVGKNKKVFIYSSDGTGEVNININGDGNNIFIGTLITLGNVTINSYCSNGEITIYGAAVLGSLTICNGYKEQYKKITGGHISIGSGTSIESAFIFNPHSDAHINIGKLCMLSEDISIRNTDGHPIYDMETSACLNKVRAGNGIDIGDHVWIGKGATILKNAAVADNSIIGTQAVVTKRFSEQNSVVAGNPAKIVKRSIKWKAENSNFFNPEAEE